LLIFAESKNANGMILKIYDAIMRDEERQMLEFWGGSGVSFKSIDEFVAAIPEDDDVIDIRLNCDGGDCLEGWSIIDKLRATGKTIKATIEGHAASMASLILLAASERSGYKHAQLLIHKPYFPAYTLADAYRQEDLERLARQLEDETARALDFMVERTGADRAVLEALMNEDKFVDMEKAKELGFIHTIIEPASAAASGWRRPKGFHTENNMSKNNTLASAFKAIAEALGLKMSMEAEEAPVGYVLTSQDGTEINIDKAEGEDPAVGDAASPDGEHLMPDGTTIVIADGVITEIRDAEPEETEPETPAEEAETEAPVAEASAEEAHAAALAEKDAKIAELQARIAELEGSQMNADQQAILAKVEKAGGVAWLDKTLKSNYKPAPRERKEQTAPKASKISDDLAAARAKKAAAKRKTV
jgi:ATP-dependent Clp protease protease subunit